MDKELLQQQAEFLGLSPEAYFQCSEAERKVAKQRFERKFRTTLKRNNKKLTAEEVNEAVRGKMSEFPQLVFTNSKEIRARRASSTEVIQVDDEDEEEPFEVQEGVRVYHEGGTKPPKEPKERRDGPTLGPIQERERPTADLVGDRAPRTLNDLYARWPLGDDPHFFLRVERTAPKKFHGVDVAGFIGEIRYKVTESELQQLLGGREYKLTLYGPDPRGLSDGEGNPLIKALTDPILLTVPVLPPVLNALRKEEGTADMTMNPFAPTAAPPTTPADAQIHRANAGFFADMVKLQREDVRRREDVSQQAATSLMSYMTETTKAQQEQARQEAQRRDGEYQNQIRELKEQLKSEKEAQTTVATQVAQAKDDANKSFMSFVEKMGPDKEAEIRRLSDYYNNQLGIVRQTYEDQLRAMRDRHEGDLRRADERLKDSETKYQHLLEQERTQGRTSIEQERSQWSQREADLRTQMKEQLESERASSSQRIADLKERHEAEVKQLERAHERELRTLKDSSETRTSVSDQTHQITVGQLEAQLQEAKEEVERLRQEVEDAKDLPAQLEKMTHQAELLGYEKKDANEPKTAMERFAVTAGAGFAQLMQNAGDWVPAMMASRQQQPVRGVLPQQRQPQQPPQRSAPASQQPQRRTRGAQWAAEGVQVRRPRAEPMGFDPNPQAAPTPTSPPLPTQAAPEPAPESNQVVTTHEEQQNTPAVQQQESSPVNGQSEQQAIPLPPKFVKTFGAEASLQFLQQAEEAVKSQVNPYAFSTFMVNSFPDGARVLIENFTVGEILEAVRGIPGTEASPLLRRDGKKWVEGLFRSVKKALADQAVTASKPAESVPQTSP